MNIVEKSGKNEKNFNTLLKITVCFYLKSFHGGKTSFKCSDCGKQFPERWNLQAHIDSVHEGKKPHECKKCDHKSSSKQG